MERQHYQFGVNLDSLAEAFQGSEEVLGQMLALFVTQAPQRQAEMSAALDKDSPETARRALHSLVNIAGAIRAYGLAELAKVVGECLKNGEVDRAKDLARELADEAERVLRQVEAMRKALEVGPSVLWKSRLST